MFFFHSLLQLLLKFWADIYDYVYLRRKTKGKWVSPQGGRMMMQLFFSIFQISFDTHLATLLYELVRISVLYMLAIVLKLRDFIWHLTIFLRNVSCNWNDHVLFQLNETFYLHSTQCCYVCCLLKGFRFLKSRTTRLSSISI